MPPLRVLLVELEGLLAQQVTEKLSALGFTVESASSLGLVERLVAAPPDLTIVNLELSHGSGFGVVNRVLRMEALADLKIVLVAENATEAAVDAHRHGPTAAAAYVRRMDNSTATFAADVLGTVQRLFADRIPEVDKSDLVEVEEPLHGDGRPAPISLPAFVAELGYLVLRRLRDEDGGAVFACMDDELHRPVAVKLMAPQGDAEDRERTQRFLRERRILALLHSPHVVSVYGAGTHRNIPYLVRELIDGESLAGQIAREGPIDVVTALQRIRETAQGLKHAAAAGVIHRDVRPENIHVVDGHAKIARFGMGKRDAPDEVRITQAGLPLKDKDMRYVAPERVLGQEDARGDIYALGVTLHTLIAGSPPFSKVVPFNLLTGKLVEKPIALDVARPGTPPLVAELTARLMAEDPERRPQQYDEVLALIDAATRQLRNGDLAWETADPEPSEVLGSLRHMSVAEIVQSLELARKTATVSLPSGDQPEGKLAFESGRLVHASLGATRGDDAFFALVARRQGAFRVQYEALSLEENIKAPVTALLLEAARRTDVAEHAGDAGDVREVPEARREVANVAAVTPPPVVVPLAPLTSADSGFFSFTGEGAEGRSEPGGDIGDIRDVGGASEVKSSTPKARSELLSGRRQAGDEGDEGEDETDKLYKTKAKPRHVPTAVGFAAIAAVTAFAVWAGSHVSIGGADADDDAAAKATPALLEKTRGQLRDARASIATMQPRLAELEGARASAASVQAETIKRIAEVKANLDLAFKPALAAHRFSLRLSDDGTEAVLELAEPALFSSDGDDVNSDGKATLALIVGAVQSLEDIQVRVEGHTDDSEPRGRHRNNWGLSGARAMNVAKVLTDQGLAAARVKAIALADTVPLASNKNYKGRARNRRVELHLRTNISG